MSAITPLLPPPQTLGLVLQKLNKNRLLKITMSREMSCRHFYLVSIRITQQCKAYTFTANVIFYEKQLWV